MIEAEKNKGGRPPLYSNCIDFDAMCELYFEECDENTVTIDGADVIYPEPYLKSGLAMFLGVTTNTMLRYSKDKDSLFCSIIKRNYDRIQNDLEKRSIMNGKQATGCIFNLKCNFGLREVSSLEVSGPGGAPIQNTTITSEMTAKEAAQLFKDQIKDS